MREREREREKKKKKKKKKKNLPKLENDELLKEKRDGEINSMAMILMRKSKQKSLKKIT